MKNISATKAHTFDMELLIAIVEQGTSPVDTKDCQLVKSGDVISYGPDGDDWGALEITNPKWRIVRVPGLLKEKADALIASELPSDPHNPSPTLQKYAMQIDLAGLDNLSPGYVFGQFKPPNIDLKDKKQIADWVKTLPSLDPNAFFSLASLKPPYQRK